MKTTSGDRVNVLTATEIWNTLCLYLKDETLRTGELVVPHGFVHEQEEQAGQEGQGDEDQTCNLSNNNHTAWLVTKEKTVYILLLQSSKAMKTQKHTIRGGAR